MTETTLQRLETTSQVVRRENGLRIFIPPAWIVEGESRVSYTTMIRLIECCREYHWLKDVKMKSEAMDSITRNLTADFFLPVTANGYIDISYSIKNVGVKSYTLEFLLTNEKNELCAMVEMVSVFYDPISEKPIPIPDKILKKER